MERNGAWTLSVNAAMSTLSNVGPVEGKVRAAVSEVDSRGAAFQKRKVGDVPFCGRRFLLLASLGAHLGGLEGFRNQ